MGLNLSGDLGKDWGKIFLSLHLTWDSYPSGFCQNILKTSVLAKAYWSKRQLGQAIDRSTGLGSRNRLGKEIDVETRSF